MLLLEAKDLNKQFGVKTVFDIAHLRICAGDRIGLVGINGAGKSTLLRVLAGESSADSGTLRRLCPVAVIRQDGETVGKGSAQLCSRLGLRASAVKSGGERTRMAIAAAFSADTPLLFADEPTTNLDIRGIEALQGLLLGFPGALVLVSHDRVLLDTVCDQIWELEDGALRVFPGTYSAWLAQKQRERAFAQSAYEQYCAEKQRLAAEVNNIREQARGMRRPPKRMGNSEARLHRKLGVVAKQGKVQQRARQLKARMEQLEVRERPHDLPEIEMPLGDPTPVRAKAAARLAPVTVRYGAHTVLENASLTLPVGSRTVLLGDNGAGKTTLLRALIEQGKLAQGVRIGYFSQAHETLDEHKTVLENACADSALPVHIVRTLLANLYLGAQDIDKPVAVLSGGERAKTMLARLLAAKVHLLILDEPTNHLDVYTLDALERLLLQWSGTLLLATHDRALASRVADRLVLVKDGQATAFEGDMSAWEAEQNRRAHPDTPARALLEVRMAALNARMSCPQKGDDPEALKRAWEALMREYQAL